MNEDLRFITRHYRKGMFAVEPALRRIKGRASTWWTRTRIAAACIAAVILSATAAVFVQNYRGQGVDPETATIEQTAIPATEIVRVIDFEEAPLTKVVEMIREVYGVEVTNIPSDPDQYTLSLHYEGSAIDLLETINDILDTDMKVSE